MHCPKSSPSITATTITSITSSSSDNFSDHYQQQLANIDKPSSGQHQYSSFQPYSSAASLAGSSVGTTSQCSLQNLQKLQSLSSSASSLLSSESRDGFEEMESLQIRSKMQITSTTSVTTPSSSFKAPKSNLKTNTVIVSLRNRRLPLQISGRQSGNSLETEENDEEEEVEEMTMNYTENDRDKHDQTEETDPFDSNNNQVLSPGQDPYRLSFATISTSPLSSLQLNKMHFKIHSPKRNRKRLPAEPVTVTGRTLKHLNNPLTMQYQQSTSVLSAPPLSKPSKSSASAADTPVKKGRKNARIASYDLKTATTSLVSVQSFQSKFQIKLKSAKSQKSCPDLKMTGKIKAKPVDKVNAEKVKSKSSGNNLFQSFPASWTKTSKFFKRGSSSLQLRRNSGVLNGSMRRKGQNKSVRSLKQSKFSKKENFQMSKSTKVVDISQLSAASTSKMHSRSENGGKSPAKKPNSFFGKLKKLVPFTIVSDSSSSFDTNVDSYTENSSGNTESSLEPSKSFSPYNAFAGTEGLSPFPLRPQSSPVKSPPGSPKPPYILHRVEAYVVKDDDDFDKDSLAKIKIAKYQNALDLGISKLNFDNRQIFATTVGASEYPIRPEATSREVLKSFAQSHRAEIKSTGDQYDLDQVMGAVTKMLKRCAGVSNQDQDPGSSTVQLWFAARAQLPKNGVWNFLDRSKKNSLNSHHQEMYFFITTAVEPPEEPYIDLLYRQANMLKPFSLLTAGWEPENEEEFQKLVRQLEPVNTIFKGVKSKKPKHHPKVKPEDLAPFAAIDVDRRLEQLVKRYVDFVESGLEFTNRRFVLVYDLRRAKKDVKSAIRASIATLADDFEDASFPTTISSPTGCVFSCCKTNHHRSSGRPNRTANGYDDNEDKNENSDKVRADDNSNKLKVEIPASVDFSSSNLLDVSSLNNNKNTENSSQIGPNSNIFDEQTDEDCIVTSDFQQQLNSNILDNFSSKRDRPEYSDHHFIRPSSAPISELQASGSCIFNSCCNKLCGCCCVCSCCSCTAVTPLSPTMNTTNSAPFDKPQNLANIKVRLSESSDAGIPSLAEYESPATSAGSSSKEQSFNKEHFQDTENNKGRSQNPNQDQDEVSPTFAVKNSQKQNPNLPVNLKAVKRRNELAKSKRAGATKLDGETVEKNDSFDETDNCGTLRTTKMKRPLSASVSSLSSNSENLMFTIDSSLSYSPPPAMDTKINTNTKNCLSASTNFCADDERNDNKRAELLANKSVSKSTSRLSTFIKGHQKKASTSSSKCGKFSYMSVSSSIASTVDSIETSSPPEQMGLFRHEAPEPFAIDGHRSLLNFALKKLFLAILANDGLKTEGIFRRSGNARNLKPLRALLERIYANTQRNNADYITGTNDGGGGNLGDVGDGNFESKNQTRLEKEEIHCLQSDLQKLMHDYSVYDLAVILKKYIQELPNGGILLSAGFTTMDSFTLESQQMKKAEWLEVARKISRLSMLNNSAHLSSVLDRLYQQIRALLGLNPLVTTNSSPAIHLLRYTLSLLKAIASNESVTRMDATNLAICFGPTLLPEYDPLTDLKNKKNKNSVSSGSLLNFMADNLRQWSKSTRDLFHLGSVSGIMSVSTPGETSISSGHKSRFYSTLDSIDVHPPLEIREKFQEQQKQKMMFQSMAHSDLVSNPCSSLIPQSSIDLINGLAKFLIVHCDEIFSLEDVHLYGAIDGNSTGSPLPTSKWIAHLQKEELDPDPIVRASMSGSNSDLKFIGEDDAGSFEDDVFAMEEADDEATIIETPVVAEHKDSNIPNFFTFPEIPSSSTPKWNTTIFPLPELKIGQVKNFNQKSTFADVFSENLSNEIVIEGLTSVDVSKRENLTIFNQENLLSSTSISRDVTDSKKFTKKLTLTEFIADNPDNLASFEKTKYKSNFTLSALPKLKEKGFFSKIFSFDSQSSAKSSSQTSKFFIEANFRKHDEIETDSKEVCKSQTSNSKSKKTGNFDYGGSKVTIRTSSFLRNEQLAKLGMFKSGRYQYKGEQEFNFTPVDIISPPAEFTDDKSGAMKNAGNTIVNTTTTTTTIVTPTPSTSKSLKDFVITNFSKVSEKDSKLSTFSASSSSSSSISLSTLSPFTPSDSFNKVAASSSFLSSSDKMVETPPPPFLAHSMFPSSKEEGSNSLISSSSVGFCGSANPIVFKNSEQSLQRTASEPSIAEDESVQFHFHKSTSAYGYLNFYQSTNKSASFIPPLVQDFITNNGFLIRL